MNPRILFSFSVSTCLSNNSLIPSLISIKLAPTFLLCTSKYKKLLISKRRIGILKKLPKQGEDSESL